MKKLYYMEVYRFGDYYSLITEDQTKGYKTLVKWYKEKYRRLNDENPTSEEVEDFLECIEEKEMELEKVWSPYE